MKSFKALNCISLKAFMVVLLTMDCLLLKKKFKIHKHQCFKVTQATFLFKNFLFAIDLTKQFAPYEFLLKA